LDNVQGTKYNYTSTVYTRKKKTNPLKSDKGYKPCELKHH